MDRKAGEGLAHLAEVGAVAGDDQGDITPGLADLLECLSQQWQISVDADSAGVKDLVWLAYADARQWSMSR